LPVIDFLKPKASTPMIDAGVEVGRPYRGKKPDIGAIER
jgi:hypothetical protein